MSIYIDVSAAVHRRAGLGRYAESLARALVAAHPDRYGLFYNREQGVEPLRGLEHLPTRTVAMGYKPWRMLVWLGQLARTGFDRLLPDARLFHATEHLLLPLRGLPTVLTVHDLIFRHLPAHHKPLNRWYLNLTMPLYCRRATHIIAVSQQTRRDLVTAYAVPPEKVTVVHEAAAPRFRPQPPETVAAVRARYNLPDRYLLFVGTIEPRKNLARLLAAFEAVYAEGLTDGLVIVGKRGWLYEGFFARLETSPARRAVLLPGYVPDDDLPAIYAGAQALVLPSLYEGFGLPVLEAMACGTPVAASNRSSIPEVGGEAALYFDPTDTDEIFETIHTLLSDAGLRGKMQEQGASHAARFSWERMAQETWEVYERVIA
ncbi:MAG TPA: glycosyltransferase family 1 protein [Anaerolineales bacterium]|nr:glycosyltransferase family 1 protein [Anaerolineae bacterium]HIQ02106.1 glycosyltransferase family 1 protein [Anaerolineales bacterium]